MNTTQIAATRDADTMALAQAAANDRVQAMLDTTRAQLADTSEDSYATRSGLHRRISDLAFARGRIMRPVDGTINFGRVLVDFGHDAEAAASDQACGIEHVSEADQARTEHAVLIERLAPEIYTLRHAGFTVLTELVFVPAPEPADDESP